MPIKSERIAKYLAALTKLDWEVWKRSEAHKWDQHITQLCRNEVAHEVEVHSYHNTLAFFVFVLRGSEMVL